MAGKSNKSNEKKGSKTVTNTSVRVNNPVIVNGECSFCPFNGDILKESITCYICSKLFHTACRDKRGIQLNSSICNQSFLEQHSPISSHYGKNKKRWGKFSFICDFCNTPDLYVKKDSCRIIDVVNVTKSPIKSSNISSCDWKNIETQTMISGDMNGYDSVSDFDYDVSNSSLLDDVKSLLDANNQILKGIKTLHDQSSSNSEKFGKQVTEIQNSFNDYTTMNPVQNIMEQLNSPSMLDNVQNLGDNSTVTQKCKPFVELQNDFLDEPLLNDLTVFLNNTQSFQTVKSKNVNSSRDVLYFGEFKYRYGAVTHEAKEIPDVIQPIINKISESNPNLLSVNSCLVTRYKDGKNVCPRHSDDEPFIAPKSNIFTLSIGSQRTMEFTSTDGTSSKALELPNNSLLSFTRVSQEFWKHEIPSSTSSSVRYSLTFRLLAPYYANSTLIVGDSNTEHINFGSGRNKLGVWLPGERIKAGRICNIPGPGDISVPYRHMVIHSGINDLRSPKHLPIPMIAKNLNEKCNALLKTFPKMKIHISCIFPTKDPGLNSMANELNQYINQISKNHQNISVITHNNMTDHTGKLNVNFGRHNADGTSVKHDTVHLGSKGIALLCMNIKQCIIKMKSSANSSVDNLNQVNQNIAQEPKYPYWFPNHEYQSSVKAQTPESNPWTGEHNWNFPNRDFQIFNVNNTQNGYQTYE